ncbi:MAG: chemotaxis protein [Kofleriaceae bacterium]|nr:chemotaxis protein [Kofleriaceae bacterium]
MSISTSDFDFVAELVQRKSAILLPKGKEYLVEARLDYLAKQKGLPSIAELVSRVRKQPYSELPDELVDALTTNETSFFRDLRPFEGLKEVIIPALMKARSVPRTLNIWCAACSSGQEPYSVLITLFENFPDLINWNINYFATDFSAEMVERTTNGIYADLEVKRGLSEELRTKYFNKVDAGWQAKPMLRNMLQIRRLNLIEPWTLPPIDLIMMRNVLIYFSNDIKKDILGRVRKTLTPDGYLMLGAAETTISIDNSYSVEDAGPARCYRPKTGGEAVSMPQAQKGL